jgi:hypothetical protein
MGKVHDAISVYGKKHFGHGGAKETLSALLRGGKTVMDIADMFDCTVPAIRHWLIRLSLLKPKLRIPVKVKRLGYSDMKAYFHANPKKLVKDMAHELDCCYQTVCYWKSRLKNFSRKA